jgi:hypothetical protein
MRLMFVDVRNDKLGLKILLPIKLNLNRHSSKVESIEMEIFEISFNQVFSGKVKNSNFQVSSQNFSLNLFRSFLYCNQLFFQSIIL